MRTWCLHLAVAIVCVAAALAVIAKSASRDDTTRMFVRSAMSNAGVEVSDVWMRVDSDAKVISMGGSLASVEQAVSFFTILGGFTDSIATVKQSVTTPKGAVPVPGEYQNGSITNWHERFFGKTVSLKESLENALSTNKTSADEQLEFYVSTPATESTGETAVAEAATNQPPRKPLPSPEP